MTILGINACSHWAGATKKSFKDVNRILTWSLNTEFLKPRQNENDLHGKETRKPHVLATNLAGTLSMNLLEQDMINNTSPRLNLQTFIGVVNVNIIWNNIIYIYIYVFDVDLRVIPICGTDR